MGIRYHLDNNYIASPVKYGEHYLVQLGRLFCSADTVISDHLHLNWYELTIVTDGGGTVGTNGCDIPVSAGDIYISFPTDLHNIRPDASSPLKFDFISFFTENEELRSQLERIRSAFIDPKARILRDDRIKRITSLLMKELADEQTLFRDEMSAALLTELIICIIRDMDGRSTELAFMNTDDRDVLCYQMMSYIDTHIFTMTGLGELAKELNYNYCYLSHLYKVSTGQTLSEYYRAAKLRAAKLLIEEGKLKISEIAELLNYSSIYVFSRAFKQQYGYPPTLGENMEK